MTLRTKRLSTGAVDAIKILIALEAQDKLMHWQKLFFELVTIDVTAVLAPPKIIAQPVKVFCKTLPICQVILIVRCLHLYRGLKSTGNPMGNRATSHFSDGIIPCGKNLHSLTCESALKSPCTSLAAEALFMTPRLGLPGHFRFSDRVLHIQMLGSVASTRRSCSPPLAAMPVPCAPGRPNTALR